MSLSVPLATITNTPLTESQISTLNHLKDKVVGRAPAQKRRQRSREGEDEGQPAVPDKEKPYFDLGRQFARISDPFTDVAHAVTMGIKDECADADEELQNQELFKDPMNLHSLRTWKIWTAKYSCFRDDMLAAQEHGVNSTRIINKITAKVTEGMNTIRAVDTSSLKQAVLKYIRDDTSEVVGLKNKADRGWNHATTAHLLCPLAWEANESTYDAIVEGRKTLTANHYPRLLYPNGHLYNPDDLETGLLQSTLLFRATKHIFMGPSAALEAPGYHRGKRSNATILGLSSMTPETIAYVAVQVRHALSSQLNWSATDVSFDYSVFYWNIVGIFDNDEGKHILDAYNYQVFGPQNNLPEEEEEIVSDLDRVREERARKRARRDNNASLSGLA